MDELAKLITAVASLAWPMVFAVVLYKLFEPIRSIVASALGRKFTIKIAGNELTMEEVSEQQRSIVNDLQRKVAELENRVGSMPNASSTKNLVVGQSAKRILWVDDSPRNNSLFAAALEERGARVDIALSTEDGLMKFKKQPYDIVLSDMGRPEGEKAGIDLTTRLKAINPAIPIFIFCGSWAARNLRAEALSAGASEITSSGTTLLAALPLTDEA
jgi:CheY-like chemotaxis protein